MPNPWKKYQSATPTPANPWERYGAPPPVETISKPQPVSKPSSQGGFFENLLPRSIMHPIESQKEEWQNLKEHPLKSLLEAAAGPALPAVEGLYGGAKRIGGELLQAGNNFNPWHPSAANNNPAESLTHVIKAIPIAGPAIANAADKPDVGGTGSYAGDLLSTIKSPSAMGTLTGAAAQLAPMALGAIDEQIPSRTPVGSIRDMAIGDRDAAALRGMRVPANGKKVVPMQDSLATAKPYLQGADSLEDLQSLVKPAKKEIYKPIADTLEAVGDNPVKGPDGMTTMRELEAERKQLSAMNRGLKTGDPAALQLAQQKGLSQADALAREKAVAAALDPALEQYGVDPKAIRKAYGAVSQVGNQIAGRSTLLEKPQPYGFAKLANPFELAKGVELTKPATYAKPLGNIFDAGKDITAGRFWSDNPTDVNIREGFAKSGPKPSFGQYTPFKPTGLLGAPPIELGASPEISGTPAGFRPSPFYADTDAMRLGRLLPAPPIELGGSVEGPKGPAFRFDTTPMRKGNILPPPIEDLPLSSLSDIFKEQRPGATRVRPKTIEGKK